VGPVQSVGRTLKRAPLRASTNTRTGVVLYRTFTYQDKGFPPYRTGLYANS